MRVGRNVSLITHPQTFFREITVWRNLSKHDHILPFMGIVMEPPAPLRTVKLCPCMVSPWMEGGNIRQRIDTILKGNEREKYTDEQLTQKVNKWVCGELPLQQFVTDHAYFLIVAPPDCPWLEGTSQM